MNDRIEGAKWIAFALLFIGMILKWIHVDENGILFNTGFIAFGVVALVDALKAKHHKQFSLDTLRIILPFVIIVIAAGDIINSESHSVLMLIAVMLLSGIAQRKTLFLERRK
jgi:hypothetical protein